jgi:hypothetical protein
MVWLSSCISVVSNGTKEYIYLPKVGLVLAKYNEHLYTYVARSSENSYQTVTSSTPTQTQAVLGRCLKDGIKPIWRLPIQYQPRSCHYILISIVPSMTLMKLWTQPRAVAPQPKPRGCYKVCMFFIMLTPKGWNHLHMYTSTMSV